MEIFRDIGLPVQDKSHQKGTREATIESSERIRPAGVQVMLVGMQGEGGFSLHDPIGLGVIAKRVTTDHPDVDMEQYDAQPELAETGKIDTDALAQRIHAFAVKPGKENHAKVIGFGMPIYAANYTQIVLEKYQQLCEDEPPQGQVEIVLGGSIPSHTDPKLVREMFPGVKLVRGEGEERFSTMVQEIKDGEKITEVDKFEWANLENYAGADRTLTVGILRHGGMPKTETSRGCGHGACTFCSRPEAQGRKTLKLTAIKEPVASGRGGKDYRTIPPETVVEEIRGLHEITVTEQIDSVETILETFTATRFEITDEDAFSDIEATVGLVSALKAAQLDTENPLPRIPFGASLRVETLNDLANTSVAEDGTSLLDQLREVGLDKVFLGVEGGSDAYLKLIAKHQKVSAVDEAVGHVTESVWVSETGEEKPLEMEMGFITFSWRMNMDMLKANIEFLGENSRYVSSLFNILEVRAGTLDEKILRESVYGKPTRSGGVVKPQLPEHFEGYDPDANFNINTSTYDDVPYYDQEVGRICKEAGTFAQADESLYYAIKSINRADSLPEDQKDKARDFYLRMKDLHLKFLRNAVGLEEITDVPEQRHALVQEIADTFGKEAQGDALDSLRRETQAFLNEEKERQEATGKQIGAMLVAQDEKDRILLVRPRNQNTWALPGGNIKEGESPIMAAVRETVEEVGVDHKDVQITGILPKKTYNDHMDRTTGLRESLELYHFKGKITGKINILQADHEIADTLFVSPEDIIAGKVKVCKNVSETAAFMLDHKNDPTVIYQN